MENYRRTKFLTSFRYQLKFTLLIMLAMGLIAFVIASAFYYDISRTLTSEEALTLIRWESYIMKAGLLLAIAFVAGIFFSHKIIGPVKRLENAIKRINGGDFTISVNLRAGDDFRKFSKELCILAEKLERASEKFPGLREVISEKKPPEEDGTDKV